MSLSPLEQFSDLVRKSERPIIFLPAYPDKDALASGLALVRFFSKLGKEATLAGDRLSLHLSELPFLSTPENILETLSGTRDFVLAFETAHNKILSMRSEQDGDSFKIFITPEKGSIDPRDFSFIPGQIRYDAAFVLGAPDKERLGKIYEENPDIFYEIPVANIDSRAENERFGQINLTDTTASSVSEILCDALLTIGNDLIDQELAEMLLAGIIAATESFQKKNTTPKALKTASLLIDAGADREKIVLSLYKTQPFHLLKLWGRLMSGLKWEEPLRLAYATATVDDFVQSRSSPDDIPAILEKIRGNLSSGAYFAILFPETAETSRVILKTSQSVSVSGLLPAIASAELRGDLLSFPIAAPANDQGEAALVALLKDALAVGR
jgi:nanoRNase/pAp phosphatase (c-di-AMP/oligoRNAs hydrolase)